MKHKICTYRLILPCSQKLTHMSYLCAERSSSSSFILPFFEFGTLWIIGAGVLKSIGDIVCTKC